MVTLVKIMATDDVKNAGIALQTCRVERDLIKQVGDSLSPALGRLESDATHQTVHFVAPLEKLLSQITAVLPCDTGDENLFSHYA
jgi:hypothetical protein